MKAQLETRTKQFALGIIRYVGQIPRRNCSDVLCRQLLKSGTSIGANYREANRAESRDDFIHKLGICEKESSETQYWLELLEESGLGPAGQSRNLRDEAGELLAIFVASGRTAKARRKL
jgi:four helix bundle protein